MTFLTLQDQLREHIRARIRRRELTGSGLARATGFPQGHLSNFLNFRRGLSLDSMDRLLATLGIGILDLISREDIQDRAGATAASDLEQVALVSWENAMLARFRREQVLGSRGFSRSFLRRLKASDHHRRGDWQRFVLVRLDAGWIHDVFSCDAVAAMLLVDRHYNSLDPYRRTKPNLYAADFGQGCAAGHLSLIDGNLVLRTHNSQRELQSVHIPAGRNYSQHIVGRIVHVGLEV